MDNPDLISESYRFHQAARFIVSEPAERFDPNRVSLSITSTQSVFISSRTADFTFHVYNHSNQVRNVTIYYSIPHHRKGGSNSISNIQPCEIKNGQELAVLLNYGDQFVVTIWNYSNDDFFLDNAQSINIIEGQDYISIPEATDARIPVGMSISFLVTMEALPYYRSRGIIEIISEDPDDEDFEFGLWLNGSSSSL